MSEARDLIWGMVALYVMYGAIIGTAVVLAGDRQTGFWMTAIMFYLVVIGWPLFMGTYRSRDLGGRDE